MIDKMLSKEEALRLFNENAIFMYSEDISGFLKLVSEHNYLLIVKAHKESEGGHIVDKYEKERERIIDELDAKDEICC